MPELPEVETVKRSLQKKIIGKKIIRVLINYGGNIRQPGMEMFRLSLVDKVFEDIDRRGKFLIFYLSEEMALVVHLRMTGQLVYTESELPLEKHTHLIFRLNDGMDLRYLDIRKFGTFDLLSREKLSNFKSLNQLGPEPLSEDFTVEKMRESISKSERVIKNLLMDQTFVAGIGNIYADEILFEVGLHPETNIQSLSEKDFYSLHEAIVAILNLGISHRGTTFRNYVDGDGRQGQFQELLKVYGRKGNLCSRCEAEIQKIKVGGRGTYYCPKCQPKA